MPEDKIEAEDLVKDLIVGFGILEGLWIYVGMNPMTEIAKAFSNIAPEGVNFFGWQFSLILFMITLVQISAVHYYGGMAGILALILAFLGGIFIGTGLFGIALIIIGVLLGLWAFKTERKISIMDVIDLIRDVINYFKKKLR